MMKDSTVCLTTDTDVSFDKGEEALTRVASLKYIGDADIDDMGYLALIALSSFSKFLPFSASAYAS